MNVRVTIFKGIRIEPGCHSPGSIESFEQINVVPCGALRLLSAIASHDVQQDLKSDGVFSRNHMGLGSL
jgi:hypothetical protein